MADEVKTKLDSMTKTCRCVINFPLKRKIEDICDDLSAYQYVYALIVHDKDVDNQGVLKTKHIHLVFECPKRHRVSFYIARLSEYFGCERNQVSVQVSNSFDGDIQYLIHKNNAHKYQYPVNAIKSNMSKEELDERLVRDIHKEVTALYILSIVKTCRTKTDISLKLGIGIYNLYYKIVDDYIRDGWLGYDLRVHTEEEKDRVFG